MLNVDECETMSQKYRVAFITYLRVHAQDVLQPISCNSLQFPQIFVTLQSICLFKFIQNGTKCVCFDYIMYLSYSFCILFYAQLEKVLHRIIVMENNRK